MKNIDELGISPDPWNSNPNDPAGPMVADANNGFICGNWNMSLADARLIAAAPELYECLYNFVRAVSCARNKKCNTCKNQECCVRIANSVLAKAAGEAK